MTQEVAWFYSMPVDRLLIFLLPPGKLALEFNYMPRTGTK